MTDTAERSEVTRLLAASGRTARDLHQESADEVDRADAVVYAFSRGLHERDRLAVEEFAGPVAGTMSPLKAVGVLTKCDQQYWPPGPGLTGAADPMDYDPMATATTIADRYQAQTQVNRLFYAIVPVAGLVASGARSLSPEKFDWLADLARTADPRRSCTTWRTPANSRTPSGCEGCRCRPRSGGCSSRSSAPGGSTWAAGICAPSWVRRRCGTSSSRAAVSSGSEG
ncbi:hypothetical protein ACFQ9X_29260 [Catenulispora yoronensis]